MRIKIYLAAALLMGGATSATVAQDASAALHTRALAATCANCHGTDGRTVDGSAIPSLVGMPKSYMIMQFNAFKDGSRPATVMHQLSKGFTDQQIDSIATYFAATKR
ncbi:c-type cytochrome [Polaromonas sp. AET17H-212]|uniref:c-type cytochrome n=1 Tax=Polaromonas sp. AET17H-212 TaxID=1977061 RepID=UPI001144C3E8|nr:c-type cytochrome [Polaromonas sp. AET17H-212]